MQIKLSFKLDDRCRRAVAHYYGRNAPATREEVRNLIEAHVEALFQELTHEMDREFATDDE